MLLAKHAEQFDEFIYEDYKDLFERIKQWAQHKNYDMKKLAYLTLDSYYKQVINRIQSRKKKLSYIKHLFHYIKVGRNAQEKIKNRIGKVQENF